MLPGAGVHRAQRIPYRAKAAAAGKHRAFTRHRGNWHQVRLDDRNRALHQRGQARCDLPVVDRQNDNVIGANIVGALHRILGRACRDEKDRKLDLRGTQSGDCLMTPKVGAEIHDNGIEMIGS